MDPQTKQTPPESEKSHQMQYEMPKNKPGKGRKILIGILLLALIGGVAYGAYWYGQQQAKKENEAKVAELQAQIDATKAGMQKSADTETSAEDYLAIKQWGIKVPLDPSYSDITYTIKKTIEGTEYAGVFAVRLASIGVCADYEGEFGAIIKNKPSTGQDGRSFPLEESLVLEGVSYTWSPSQNNCTTDSDLEDGYKTAMSNNFTQTVVMED